MPSINPYLSFNGNAEEAFNFYRSVFGGEFAAVMRFKDSPPQYQGSEKESEKIMHIALPIGKGNMLMASDVPEAYPEPVAGSGYSISVTADSEQDAKKIFDGLSEGGKVTMPLDKAFWGALFGMLSDKFGVQWMVSYDYNRQQ